MDSAYKALLWSSDERRGSGKETAILVQAAVIWVSVYAQHCIKKCYWSYGVIHSAIHKRQIKEFNRFTEINRAFNLAPAGFLKPEQRMLENSSIEEGVLSLLAGNIPWHWKRIIEYKKIWITVEVQGSMGPLPADFTSYFINGNGGTIGSCAGRE